MDNSESKTKKYLKDYLHYSDLYDRHTVEMCRRTEKVCAKPTELPEDSKLDKEEAARAEKAAKKFILYVEKGERYINKAKTIQEWMDRDKKRDDFYESAQAPEDIRCLTCRNRMKVIHKDFWYGIDDKEEDRVLFMYECPNQCLPRRAFFSNGEEWRVKPRLCLKCDTLLDSKANKTDKKIVTTHFCPKCGYEEVDEFELSSGKEKSDELDENFGKDRERFCLTDEEGRDYKEAKWNMEQMARLGKEFEEEQKRRDEKLKENPKGFHLESVGYTCFICGDHTKESDNWYDEYGIKCLVCQKAIDEGEIPASLAKDKDSWYSEYDLKRAFNLTPANLRLWVKEGVIKARTVSSYGKGVHFQLFLIEDNKDFLPPKNLVDSKSVKTRKDGKDWHHLEEWYKFVDPFEHLKGYKIMNHMRIVPPEEMAAREAEEKKKQEERQARLAQRRLNRSKKKI